jgi:predicted dehydrogenase
MKIKLALIGAGNIMRTRHLPALKSNLNRFELTGILDPSAERAKEVASHFGIPNHAAVKPGRLCEEKWFQDSEAVIIATPPKTHASAVEACLLANKHVLVEKPFVTSLEEGARLVSLAEQRQRILAVNQNFQFSSSFQRLETLLERGDLGAIRSFYCIQFSNDTRRLPSWGDELPLGLFYDESPHAFYLLRRFSKGELSIADVSYRKSLRTNNTPQILDINLFANGIPATVYSNFESPICEWYFIVFGDQKYAMVDLFRDIITVLPNDGQHLMKEVFTTSFLATIQHWRGFVRNGFKYIRKRLHYGMDCTHRNFHAAITTGDQEILFNMTGRDGLKVNEAQFAVAAKVSESQSREAHYGVV